MPPEDHAPWRIVLCTDNHLVAQFYRAFLPSKGHRVVGLVTSAKRNPHFLDVVAAMPPETDVIVSSHPRHWAGMLAGLRPDLLVATVFPWRIPTDVLALPRLGAVNAHPALLPRYRGTDTPFWHLRNGEQESGWTLHRMTADFDTGAILAQVRFPLDDDDDVGALMGKYVAAFTPLWDAALPRIARGDPGEPQSEAEASYFGQIADEAAWRRINWSAPAREVHNLVRSCGFEREMPAGAVGEIDGVMRRITRTRLVARVASSGARPGTMVGREGETLLVQCGDGLLQVLAHDDQTAESNK